MTTKTLWIALVPAAAAAVLVGFGAMRVKAVEEGVLLATSVSALAFSHVALRSRRRQAAAEEDARQARAALAVRAEADECERQQQTVSSFAELAARVAHEVRNPLTSIELNLELLEEEFTDCGCKRGPRVRELVVSMQSETRRLRDFSEEYLAFARPPRTALLSEDLDEIARDLVSLVGEEALRRGAVLSAASEASPARALIDRNQVKQAALNLVKNAIQAVPAGGAVEVRTSTANGEARLAVANTGPGIPAEARCRIFQPFFTTKPGGTGLGLPLVLHVMREHGGEVRVEDRPGGGTVFTLAFRALKGGSSPRDSVVQEAAPAEAL